MGANRGRERGQILIMTALISIPLFGMMGLVTDIGYMHYVKMTAQSAAETAAYSAMLDFRATSGGATLNCTPNGNVVCTNGAQVGCTPSITSPANSIEHGCMYAQAHGFNSTNSVTYESANNSAPPTAPNIGSVAYWVTFRTYQRVPQLFSAVTGNTTGLVVGRSTAALVGLPDCIYTLAPGGTDISVSGTANFISSCGMYADSSSSCAIYTNGTTTLQAPNYDVVGGTCTHAALLPPPNTGVSVAPDPLADIPAPASPPYVCDHTNFTVPNNGKPLSPGVYCGGISVQNSSATFSAGTYILVGGGLSVSANGSVTGIGVTFYNTYNTTYPYAGIYIHANAMVDLVAPNDGVDPGMLFFDDRTAPTGNPDQYGGGPMATYQGIIYNSRNGITMYGNSGTTTAYTMVVAQTFSLVGTTTFNNDYSSLPGGKSPLQQVMVVE